MWSNARKYVVSNNSEARETKQNRGNKNKIVFNCWIDSIIINKRYTQNEIETAWKKRYQTHIHTHNQNYNYDCDYESAISNESVNLFKWRSPFFFRQKDERKLIHTFFAFKWCDVLKIQPGSTLHIYPLITQLTDRCCSQAQFLFRCDGNFFAHKNESDFWCYWS